MIEYGYTIVPYAAGTGGERTGEAATLEPNVNLEPLSDLQVVRADHDAVTLAWKGLENHPFGADITYTLHRSGGVGDLDIPVPSEDGINHTYTDTYEANALLPNTTYTYTITATLGGHTTAKSNRCNAETSLPMSTAPLTVAAAGYDSLCVEWTPVTGADGYTVLRAASPLGPFALAAVVSGGASGSFTDTGLATGTSYYYRVYCFTYANPVNPLSPRLASANYAEKAGGTAPAPAAPAHLTVTAPTGAYNTLALSWSAVPGASGYSIYRVAGNEGVWQRDTKASVTTHTFTGLAEGDHTYYVLAWRTVGKTKFYSDVEESPRVTGTPAFLPPVGGTLTAGIDDHHKVKLTWDPMPVATGYTIYRAPADDAADPANWTKLKTLAAGVTTYVDAGVPAGKWVYNIVPRFSVAGKTVNGEALACSAVTVDAWTDFTPFTASQESPVYTLDKPHRVTLNWTPVPGAAGYRIYRDGALAATIKKGTTATWTQVGVPEGDYEYAITAYITVSGKACESTPGTYDPVTVKSPLDSTAYLTAVSSSLYTVKVGWSPVDSASGYSVYRMLPTETAFTLLKNVNSRTLTYTDKAVPACYGGDKATYQVRAYLTIGGKKYYGDPGSIDVDIPGLDAVTGFTVSPGGPHAAAFSWDKMDGASGYYLQRAAGPAGPYTTEATVKAGKPAMVTTTLTSLPDGEWYFRVIPWLTVSGKKMAGKPPLYGGRLGAIEALPPPATATATADGLTHGLKLEWAKVDGATGYTIYRAETAGGAYLPAATAKAGKNALQKLTLKGQAMGSSHYMVVPTYAVKKTTFTGAGARFEFIGGFAEVQGLAAPEKVSAQESGLMGVKVSWDKVSGASGYFVYEVDADAYAADADAAVAAGALRATVNGGGKTSAVVVAPMDAAGRLLPDGARVLYRVVPYYKYGKLLLAGNGCPSDENDPFVASWEDALTAEGAVTATIDSGGLYTTRVTTRHTLSGPTGFAIRQTVDGTTTLVKNVKTGKSTATKAYSAAADTTYTVTLYRTASGQTVEWTVAEVDATFEVAALEGGSGLAVIHTGNALKPDFIWDKVTGATGYYLYRAPFESTAGARVKTVAQPKAGTSVILTGFAVPKTGTYYYYVIPYVKVGGKTYTGPASQPVAYPPG